MEFLRELIFGLGGDTTVQKVVFNIMILPTSISLVKYKKDVIC